MGYQILTHDRIITQSPGTGLLSKAGLVYGGNALQSITTGRHTPKDPVQAVGFLGIVDYHSGVITSDVQLDCILTENTSKADTAAFNNSAYKYAAKTITIGTESYVLTSAALSFQAGSPATLNLGWLTGTLASYLATYSAQQAQLTAGEEAQYAVVMGDDGSGLWLDPTWYAGTPAIQGGTIPFIDSTGALNSSSLGDAGLPAGVQSLQYSAAINRDQILDVRTNQAVNFITTYPVDVTADVELYALPCASGVLTPGASGYTGERNQFSHVMGSLQHLAVRAKNWGKHPGTPAPAGIAVLNDSYGQVRGLVLEDESEAIAVGRYLSYTFRYRASDFILPLPQNP